MAHFLLKKLRSDRHPELVEADGPEEDHVLFSDVINIF